LPLVVRLAGTNVELGKKLLEESGLPILTADSMADAAKHAVTAIQGA
jgi:succinyl-CoA synthetase beta subunit